MCALAVMILLGVCVLALLGYFLGAGVGTVLGVGVTGFRVVRWGARKVGAHTDHESPLSKLPLTYPHATAPESERSPAVETTTTPTNELSGVLWMLAALFVVLIVIGIIHGLSS